MRGAFVISLDFELFWGVRLSKSLTNYGLALLGVRTAIPGMLGLFREYDVSVTFAIVGALFFRNKTELTANLPDPPATYLNPEYDWYPQYFNRNVGNSEDEDPYHFAASLVESIMQGGRHEIATHTFSHCYSLEAKQPPDAFKTDLARAIAAGNARGAQFESIIFPGNQYDEEHLRICRALGLRGFRGNERGWMYQPAKRESNNQIRRLARLVDTYLNLTGHQTYGWDGLQESNGLFNIPASRFLRPFNTKLKSLEGLRLKRITESMTHAAKHGQIFHLWWHPHNFGTHTNENLDFLRLVLDHYRLLNKEYDFGSFKMSDFYSPERSPVVIQMVGSSAPKYGNS